MYQIHEISNRDLELLYDYRILRQPSDFLSASYSAGTPVATEIFQGSPTDFKTDRGELVYQYDLGIENIPNRIPYLEFSAGNDADRKHLETLLYLDGTSIYSTIPEFREPIQILVYWVESLSQIQDAINQFLVAMGKLSIDALRDLLANQANNAKVSLVIAGRKDNLVQLCDTGSNLGLEDSGYKITSALEAQLLVNPSQELLSTLPRRLKHSINISITDGETRCLSAFAGFSINIRGNGTWMLRDLDSGVDFVSGSGAVYAWNCKSIHFRNSLESGNPDSYRCSYLYSHRSLVVLNQGVITDMAIVGGSTFISVTNSESYTQARVNKVSLVGSGCYCYCWVGSIPIDLANIHGTAWWYNPETSDCVLYIAGRRIDEASGQHDAELQPSKLLEYNVDNIHIRQGGS